MTNKIDTKDKKNNINSVDLTIKITKNRKNGEINLNYDKVKNRFKYE